MNLGLIINSFDREFTGSVTLNELAVQLPNLRKAGMKSLNIFCFDDHRVRCAA